MAPPFLAVEPRLRAAGSLDGGFDPVPTPPEIRQSGYAPRVRTPVLMIYGSFDTYHQIEASQKPLFIGTFSAGSTVIRVRCSREDPQCSGERALPGRSPWEDAR